MGEPAAGGCRAYVLQAVGPPGPPGANDGADRSARRGSWSSARVRGESQASGETSGGRRRALDRGRLAAAIGRTAGPLCGRARRLGGPGPTSTITLAADRRARSRKLIGRQLDLDGDELADYAVRSETRHEHLAELRCLYKFRSFSGGAARGSAASPP